LCVALAQLLSQADGIPWKEALAWTGGASWIVLAWLFITNRIRTTDGAKIEIDRAYELLKQQTERADKCDERMVAAMKLADRFGNVAEEAKAEVREVKKAQEG
jgi:hypothetical protein